MLVPERICAATTDAEPGWTQFRGPHGNGTAAATDLAQTWSDTENVMWKTAIPHKGWSTPLVLGDQIWLTSATEDGKEFWGYCVDRNTGKMLHDVKLFTS